MDPPGATVEEKGVTVGVPMASPLRKISEYAVVQVHVPTFLIRHVLVKVAPGVKFVPSGTVTSAMNCPMSQALAATGRGARAVPGRNWTSMVAISTTGVTMRRKIMSSSSNWRKIGALLCANKISAHLSQDDRPY
jgi:hypothetical protein